MRGMRIAAVCELNLSVRDGSVTHFMELTSHLTKQNHRVQIFAPKLGKYKGKKLSNLKIQYVPTLNFSTTSFFFYISKILMYVSYQLFLLFYLCRFVKNSKADIIYNRMGMLSLAPVIVSKVADVPLIVEINGIISEELKMVGVPKPFIHSFKLFEKITCRSSKKIVVVTKGIKNTIQKDYKIPQNSIVVIHNGVNTDLFKPMDINKTRALLGFDLSSYYIVFVGYLAPWQGVDYLIESIPLILNKLENVKLLIVGEGPKRQRLEQMVKEKKLESNVIFTGRVAYEDVPKYINAGDICVAPFVKAKGDLSPLKIYEYLACGKPVVASNVEGVGNFVSKSKSGIATEPQDPRKLAGSILSLLTNEGLREEMGRNGRKIVTEEYTWDLVARMVWKVCSASCR